MYSHSEIFERAEEALKELLEKGIKPDLISYNTVIYAYCRNGQMREASRIFLEMKDSGLGSGLVGFVGDLQPGFKQLCRSAHAAWACRKNAVGVGGKKGVLFNPTKNDAVSYLKIIIIKNK
jgi:pentatricopeptide repeat protein